MKTRIFKNIPIPPKHNSNGAGLTAIIRKLKVNESFYLPMATKLTCVAPAARSLGIKVITRKMPNKRVMVWRVK